MEYIAHISEDKRKQTIKNHSENTAKLCNEFSVDEFKKICSYLGLVHDAGKYLDAFQKKINGDFGIHVEHSIVGAKIIEQKIQKSPLSLLMELNVAGHHTGIPDTGSIGDCAEDSTLFGRMNRKTDDFSEFYNEITLNEPEAETFSQYLKNGCATKEDLIEKYAFVVRYCFSCLTDADYIDTAEFMNGTVRETLKSNFSLCLDRINNKLDSFNCTTELQKARGAIQQQVFCKTDVNSEIYLMNMPTGSGKTLCSMKFALERALKTNKRHIIYVIPYNSIIDQTAAEFEELFFGCANILRHQSTFSYEYDGNNDENYLTAIKYACENWDADIVITTAVQFFESIYSNKSSKLRKLHNMANSMIVFDEVHLMPRDNLQPCLRAVEFITKYLHSEALFLTATMPDYNKLFLEYTAGNSVIEELVSDKQDFVKFKKCQYSYIGVKDDFSILKMCKAYPTSLIVVNSKKGARELYKCFSGKKYHLSTYMTSELRTKVIAEIKTELLKLEKDYPELKNVPPERQIVVISTSLIEAGVDFDFNVVFRELSGIDNILQAGGRCNREGKRQSAKVFIFERECEQGKPIKDIRIPITKGILNEFKDITSDDAIRSYYDRLFYLSKDEITANSISNYCSKLMSIPFASYDMKMINSSTISIAVPYSINGKKAMETIRNTGYARQRDVQRFCCSVYPNEFQQLLNQHVVEDFGTGIYWLTNEDYYDVEIGILFEGQDKYL